MACDEDMTLRCGVVAGVGKGKWFSCLFGSCVSTSACFVPQDVLQKADWDTGLLQLLSCGDR